jgi:4-amino-4-deoxy-L-arabinose transferase-like glycosyltransferase
VIEHRFAVLALAAASASAALFPEVALAPVHDVVSTMRAPETAPTVARWLFCAGALTFGAIFVAWTRLSRSIARFTAWIDALAPRRYALLLLTVAVLPRLFVALAIVYEPVTDARWYHEAARSLAAGEGLAVNGATTAYRMPGYPFLLSLTYRLFGSAIGLAWVWGILATAVIVGAIHVIADRLYGAAVARLAALIAALYPAFVLMTGQALSDLPFVAGYLVLVAFVLGGRPYRLLDAFGIGICVGLLTLTRSVAIGLVAIVPIIWLLRQRDWRRCAAATVVIASAFVATIAPWIARNHSVLGRYTLDTHIGANAYIGNHRGASGGAVPDHWPTFPASMPLTEAEEDAELMRRAVDFVVANPGEALANLPRKLMHLYLLETEAVSSLFQGGHHSADLLKYSLYGVSQLAYVGFLLLFAIRLLELFTPSLRPRGAQWTGCVLTLYFTLLCLAFHGEDRYRLPILPWILIEGSVVLARPVSERAPYSGTRAILQ